MKTLGFIAGTEFGPWRMPQKAQTALLHQHAQKEGLTIDFVVSEFVIGSRYPLLLKAIADSNCENIIFVSAFQLPSEIAQMKELFSKVAGKKLFFALEDISMYANGDCSAFFSELETFRSAHILKKAEVLKARPVQPQVSSEEPTANLFLSNRVRSDELLAYEAIERNFESFPLPTRQKLENFPNWVRHRDLARFLFKAEMYRSIVNIPGVIFEAGVLFGGSLATWLHLGEIYEPVNYGRRVYGFDTFAGFPKVTEKDKPQNPKNPELYREGTYSSEHAEQHLYDLFKWLDKTRKIPQLPRMRLVKGDVCETVPRILKEDKSLLVAMLYVDVDLYEPSRAVIEACLPRMPKGSIICIDELCYEDWPGETEALIDLFNINDLEIHRSPTVPNIAYIRL